MFFVDLGMFITLKVQDENNIFAVVIKLVKMLSCRDKVALL